MAITAPLQQRTLDPFSDHRFSQVINRSTRIVTGGEDSILYPSDFPLTQYNYKIINIGPGIAFKDDVIIHTMEEYSVDFANLDFFVDDDGGGMDEIGDYYIVMTYTYGRSLPSPKAYFKIIKNLETVYFPYPERYIFLGKVEVVWDAVELRFEISNLYSMDEGLSVYRNYAKLFDELLVDGGEI